MGKGEKKGIKCQQMLCEPVHKLLSENNTLLLVPLHLLEMVVDFS